MIEYKADDSKAIANAITTLVKKCLSNKTTELSCITSYGEECYLDCNFSFKFIKKEQLKSQNDCGKE